MLILILVSLNFFVIFYSVDSSVYQLIALFYSVSILLLVQPCRPYLLVYLPSTFLIDTGPVRSCQFRSMPRCYRLRMACQPSSDRAYAGWRHSLFNFIISALKKRGGSIFRICQGSHLGSGFWGWGFQYSATVYFVPSGIRRIGSDNFHCVLGILVGFKKLMDIILFGIKIENRWNGNNTPIEYSPVFFFQ